MSAVFSPHLASLPPAAASAPNIVLVLFDELGDADIGLHGTRLIHTPHLDALKRARAGVTMTAFHAPAAVCTPSRAA